MVFFYSDFSYDFNSGKWESARSMSTARCLFALVEADGFLYAIGGRKDETPLASVERYSRTTNMWTTTQSMSMPRVAFAAAALNRCIFVIGGSTGNNCCETSLVECFDCETETWSKVYRKIEIFV